MAIKSWVDWKKALHLSSLHALLSRTPTAQRLRCAIAIPGRAITIGGDASATPALPKALFSGSDAVDNFAASS
jgi:hypothetical protein